jgi:hypothetical protein
MPTWVLRSDGVYLNLDRLYPGCMIISDPVKLTSVMITHTVLPASYTPYATVCTKCNVMIAEVDVCCACDSNVLETPLIAHDPLLQCPTRARRDHGELCDCRECDLDRMVSSYLKKTN